MIFPRLPKRKLPLAVAFYANGQPRIARVAVNRILRYKSKNPRSYGVFMAPYISVKSAAICEEEGIGYLDLAGNCHICFEEEFIKPTGNPNPFSEKWELRSLFYPRASRAIRVLLANPLKCWRLQSLAKEAEISLGQAYNVKKLLLN